MAVTNLIEITEEVIDITVNNATDITIDLLTDNVQIEINNLAVPSILSAATSISFGGHAGMEADTVQDAIIELADNAFKHDSTRRGSEADEGDTWYDMDDNQFKVYRETAPTVFEWVPIMLGNISVDSDTLDAGSF